MAVVVGALLGTLTIFCFNGILAAASVGLGLALRRAFGLREFKVEDCFTAFWMGFGLIILFAMLWNFALPLGGGIPLGIVLVTGLAAFVSMKPWARDFGASPPGRWAVIVALLFGLWVSNLSLGQMTAWDSALYHMQGVKWASAHRVLPGVANVFGPMGFNNASLLYNALLDAGPWAGRAWHVSNGVLVIVFGVQSIFAASRVFDKNARVRPYHVFSFLLLPTAVTSVYDGVPSFMTVVPGSLLLMVTAVMAYRTFNDQEQPVTEKAYLFFCLPFLAAIAVAIKLSFAVFAASMLFLSCLGIYRLGREINRLRALTWTLTGVTVVGLAWLAHGIILSGYPLFPSTVLPLPVDWRVPLEHARAEYDFVLHSARATAENVAFVAGKSQGLASWLRHWGHVALEHLYELPVPLTLAAIAALLFMVSNQRAKPADREAILPGWWTLPALSLSIVAWFITAPMPAYGQPFFWSLVALLGTQAYRLRAGSPSFRHRFFIAVCLVSLTPLVVNPIWTNEQVRVPKHPLEALLDANLKLPEPGHWYQTTPPPQLTLYTTNAGVTLRVPIGWRGRCWDAEPPCTPNPAPNLRLRVPGDIDSGFTVDGKWQMKDWPEPWRPEILPAMREGWQKRDSEMITQ